jgi:hypothetical protein
MVNKKLMTYEYPLYSLDKKNDPPAMTTLSSTAKDS